jgi:hypothetical protein
MARGPTADNPLSILSAVMIGLVKREDLDLTARGDLDPADDRDKARAAHARGLAERLAVSKPAVMHTLDRRETRASSDVMMIQPTAIPHTSPHACQFCSSRRLPP